MSKRPSDALDERWAEHLRLRQQGASLAAFVRLGEILNCVLHGEVAAKLRVTWTDKLQQVDLPIAVVDDIKREGLQKIERIERIVGAGGPLVYEEALLVLTFRVELEMLVDYLSWRHVDGLPDTSSVDAKLLETAMAHENSSAYRSAQQAAQRNWGLPLHSKWLR